jgi:hypothetical protein
MSDQQPVEDLDPTRHMAGVSDYRQLPDGTSLRVPLPLSEHAAAMRATLTKARRDEATIENDRTTGVVAFSRYRGLVIAELLGELSARLRPGTVVGAMRSDDAMADLAAELAWHLDAARTGSESGD